MTSGFLHMDWSAGCTPIITAGDCGAVPSVAPSVPSSVPAASVAPHPSSVPHPLIKPETPPVSPAVHHVSEHFGWSVGDIGSYVEPALVGAGSVVALFIATVLLAALRGWDPRQLRDIALGALVLPLGAGLMQWSAVAPFELFAHGTAGEYGLWGSAAAVAVAAVPAAWLAASIWWAHQRHRIDTVGLQSLPATLRAKERHLAAQRRAVRQAAAAATPLTAGWRHDAVVLGRAHAVVQDRAPGAVRSWLARVPALATLTRRELNEHLVVLGGTGSGKTTLLLRLITSMITADWNAYVRSNTGRPLMIFVDCKGGKDGAATGERVAELAMRLGVDARRIAVWPQRDKLRLWSMPKSALIATLEALTLTAQSSSSEGEHFVKAAKQVIRLVINAPSGPPRSSKEFLAHCSADWLMADYPESQKPNIAALMLFKPPQIPDVNNKFQLLFDELGDAFDGDRALGEFDVIYATVPGTVEEETAAAQVTALMKMVLEFAATEHNRAIRLVVDEYSAVSNAGHSVPATQLAERGRSMGVGFVVAAQNHLGLGQTDDARNRLVDDCGALVVMRGKGIDSALERYGTRKAYEASRHLLGGRHGAEGTGSLHDTWLVDPQRVRGMETGEFAVIRGTRAVFGATAPITPAEVEPLEITRRTRLDAIPADAMDRARTDRQAAAPAPAPTVQAVLDLDDDNEENAA